MSFEDFPVERQRQLVENALPLLKKQIDERHSKMNPGDVDGRATILEATQFYDRACEDFAQSNFVSAAFGCRYIDGCLRSFR
jgi:hypothetical protein